MTILIIGDSITLGAAEVRGNDIVDVVRPSYVDLLRQRLADVRIEIDADVHRTTIGVRDSIGTLLAAHVPDIVLLMIGGNDADLDWRRFVLSDGKIARNRVPVERYEKNLREITRAILAAGATPVLTDMPNHHFEIRGPYVSKLAGKDVTTMLDAGGGKAESDKRLWIYREAAETVATEMGVTLVRYGEMLDARTPAEVISHDGAHPSAGGHRVIAHALAPILKRLLQPSARQIPA